MKKFLKNNKTYIFIFLVCFFIMMLSALRQTNIFEIVCKFIFDSDYRENFTLAESNIKTSISLFDVIKQVLINYSWKFDYLLIFGTNLFQVLLPCIVSICGVMFFNNYNTIYNFSIYRGTKYKYFIKRSIRNESLKMALSVFLSFMLYYLIMLLLTHGSLSSYMGRTLFLDILGENFYNNFTYLYYIMDGLVRFFLIPFIYSYLSCFLAIYLKTQKQVFFCSNIYYYGLSIVGFGLYYLIGDLAIYINPSVIMASGTYNNVNTILLFLIHLIPLFVCYFILKRNSSNEDIY